MSGVIQEQVHELGGTEKVVGLVSDNTNLMVCVWKILMARLDSFVCVPCLAHISNLLLKDIAKIYWIDRVLTQTKDVVLFFRSHDSPLSLFREKKKIPNLHADFPLQNKIW